MEDRECRILVYMEDEKISELRIDAYVCCPLFLLTGRTILMMSVEDAITSKIIDRAGINDQLDGPTKLDPWPKLDRRPKLTRNPLRPTLHPSDIVREQFHTRASARRVPCDVGFFSMQNRWMRD